MEHRILEGKGVIVWSEGQNSQLSQVTLKKKKGYNFLSAYMKILGYSRGVALLC